MALLSTGQALFLYLSHEIMQMFCRWILVSFSPTSSSWINFRMAIVILGVIWLPTNHWNTRLNVSVRSRSNWNLEVQVFLGEGKTGVTGEKPLGARERTNNKLNPRRARKLDRVNFHKDFWDCYQGPRKKWPIADQRVPSNDPINTCGAHVVSSPLPVSKVASTPGFQPGPQ